MQILANEIFYCIFAQLINYNIMRGLQVPSFYRKMLKDKIDLLLADCFEQRSDLFLIDFSVTENNEISITIDGDNGVKVECGRWWSGLKIEIYVAELNEVNELGCLRWEGRGRDYTVIHLLVVDVLCVLVWDHAH